MRRAYDSDSTKMNRAHHREKPEPEWIWSHFLTFFEQLKVVVLKLLCTLTLN